MRIRTIKPEFWSHPVMARMDDMTQLLALALLSAADDHGYFRADTAIVRGACMPFRESLASISQALVKLSEVGWIEISFHPQQGAIGRIANWSSHQKVDHPSASKIRAYFLESALANISREPRDKLALDQGSGNRDQGGGGEDTPTPPSPPFFLASQIDPKPETEDDMGPLRKHGCRIDTEELRTEWKRDTRGLTLDQIDAVIAQHSGPVVYPNHFRAARALWESRQPKTPADLLATKDAAQAAALDREARILAEREKRAHAERALAGKQAAIFAGMALLCIIDSDTALWTPRLTAEARNALERVRACVEGGHSPGLHLAIIWRDHPELRTLAGRDEGAA